MNQYHEKNQPIGTNTAQKMMELAEDIKRAIINMFCLFKQVKENINLLRRKNGKFTLINKTCRDEKDYLKCKPHRLGLIAQDSAEEKNQ